jgi:hypothetical protein
VITIVPYVTAAGFFGIKMLIKQGLFVWGIFVISFESGILLSFSQFLIYNIMYEVVCMACSRYARSPPEDLSIAPCVIGHCSCVSCTYVLNTNAGSPSSPRIVYIVKTACGSGRLELSFSRDRGCGCLFPIRLRIYPMTQYPITKPIRRTCTFPIQNEIKIKKLLKTCGKRKFLSSFIH